MAEIQAIPQKVYKRREAIRKGVETVGALAATAVVSGAAVFAVAKTVEAVGDALSEKPSEIYFGEIEISLKDVNLRDQPKRYNVYYGDFNLSRIKKINGIAYNGENILSLQNASIVEGTNPDNPGDKGIGRWVKIKLDYEGLVGEREAYINLSKKTEGAMRFRSEGGYAKVKEAKSGVIITTSNVQLPRERLGVTKFKQAFSK